MKKKLSLGAVWLLMLCLHSAGALAQERISLIAALRKVSDAYNTQFAYEVALLEKKTTPANLGDLKRQRLEEVLKKILYPHNLLFVYVEKGHYAVIPGKTAESAGKPPVAQPSGVPGQPVHNNPAKEETRIISGEVRMDDGTPLPNASVRAGSVSTMTDGAGKFQLRMPASQQEILVSAIGFGTEKADVSQNGKTFYRLTLYTSASQLREVNVISTGYQKIEKSQLTGAASSIGAEAYDQRTAVTGNFLESLEGKVPGLVYNSASGELSIRGVSTFDAVKRPLVVIDGFPSEIDINSINPNDIISVSVLRDAAAASIYGVRASNGVIVIETRRGKSGKPVFSFRSTVGLQGKPDFDYMKYAGPREFANINKHMVLTGNDWRGLYSAASPIDTVRRALFAWNEGKISEQEADARVAALTAYDNMADYKKLFYRQRWAQQWDLDVSGGNDRATYLLGVNYVGESPTERRSDNKRLILNIANTYKFNERFSLDFRGVYTNARNEKGKTADYTDFLPFERLTDGEGKALPVTFGPSREYVQAVTGKNTDRLKALGLYDPQYYPYGELFANTTTSTMSSVRFQGRLNTRLTSWMNLDLGGAYESQNNLLDNLLTEDAYTVRQTVNKKAKKAPGTGTAIFPDMPQGAWLIKTIGKNIAYTLRGQLNINKYFDGNKHNISGILGIEQRKSTTSAFKQTLFGYDGQSLISKPINMAALNNTGRPAFPELGNFGSFFRTTNYFGETYTDRRFMSYYGEATYIYDRRYVATGSFRIDQSNLFGADPRYKNKPLWSAGASWRISEEAFMKPATWVSNLQLRAATGFNGNVPSSSNGAFLLLASGLNLDYAVSQMYYDILSPENQSIRWETTRNLNLGLDYGLFNNRLTGAVDYYVKRTADVFGLMSADPTTGFNQYNANTASIENKGLELLVSSVNVKQKNFSWRTQLTASFNQNKVLEVKRVEYEESYKMVTLTDVQKNYPTNALFSYRYAGLNNLGQPGVYDRSNNIKVMNTYGDDIIDVDFDDLVYSGTTTPKYALGLNNQFSVGMFDVSFLFMYYGGHVMRVQQPNPDGVLYDHPLEGSSNFWRKPGDEAHTDIPGFPEFGTPGDYTYAAKDGYMYADRYVRKADYIRLRDVILTCNLKSRFLEKAGLRQTQIRLQGQNMWRYTFSGNDIDPDAIDRRTGIRTLPLRPLYSLSVYTRF